MEEDIVKKQLKDYPRYYICSNGRVWDSKRNRYLKNQRTKDCPGYLSVELNSQDGLKKTSLSVKKLLREYLNIYDPFPQFEGIQHKPMFGYQGIYQIYSDGRVWNIEKGRWMTASPVTQGYLLYCLVDANKKICTKYIHRLLAENFIVNGSIEGYQVHHKNGDKYDNRIQNLKVLTPLEHEQFHKKKIHSQQTIKKMEERRQKKKEQLEKAKEYRKQHPYHHSLQTRRKISNGLKKHFKSLRGE